MLGIIYIDQSYLLAYTENFKYLIMALCVSVPKIEEKRIQDENNAAHVTLRVRFFAITLIFLCYFYLRNVSVNKKIKKNKRQTSKSTCNNT